MRGRRVVLAALLGALALPDRAAAHALLLKTSPPRRAVLREPPRQVELWFNERLEPAYASATLSTKSGAPVDTGRASVSEQDPRRLALPLPALQPGEYVVRFRVLSVDGHVAEDSLTFSVRGR
ncbi:MAG TPA: copper resistance CopC family protein [Albitalea sp.]